MSLTEFATRARAQEPITAIRGAAELLSQHDDMPAAQRARFSFTTERDRGGTGLGLSIVKAIAEASGGEVSARSGADGSIFSVVL